MCPHCRVYYIKLIQCVLGMKLNLSAVVQDTTVKLHQDEQNMIAFLGMSGGEGIETLH